MSSPCTLLEFPSHILDEIIDLLGKDAAQLSQTSSIFNHIVNQKLYREIIVVDGKGRNYKNLLHSSRNTILPLDRLPVFSDNLTPRNIRYMKRIVLASQSDGTENIYYPLYCKLRTSNSSLIQVDNLDINNLRCFNSITQFNRINKNVAFEGEEDSNDMDICQMDVPLGLQNWTIFDFNELNGMSSENPSVNELSVYIENGNSYANMASNSKLNDMSSVVNIKEILPNLKNLYLNLPASTLTFCYNYFNYVNTPLSLEKLSLTNSHSFKNFGFKSINTKLSYKKLSKLIDFSNLKELELKINCDFHNRCEESCILEFFKQWKEDASAEMKLEKLVLINFKSNSSEGNLGQITALINDYLPLEMFPNLKELYIQVDDFKNMQKISNVQLQRDAFTPVLDFVKLHHNIKNCPNLTKITLPDFFSMWFVPMDHERKGTRINYFDNLVNGCKCSACEEGRDLFARYAKYDSLHGYSHRFRHLEEEMELDTKGKHKLVDPHSIANFKFLNYLTNTFKDYFEFSHKNLFTVNSILKRNEVPYEGLPTDYKKMVQMMVHLCLNDVTKGFCEETSIKELCLGGINFG